MGREGKGRADEGRAKPIPVSRFWHWSGFAEAREQESKRGLTPETGSPAWRIAAKRARNLAAARTHARSHPSGEGLWTPVAPLEPRPQLALRSCSACGSTMFAISFFSTPNGFDDVGERRVWLPCCGARVSKSTLFPLGPTAPGNSSQDGCASLRLGSTSLLHPLPHSLRLYQVAVHSSRWPRRVGVHIFSHARRVCWDLSSFTHSCMEGFFREVPLAGFGRMETRCAWGEAAAVCHPVDPPPSGLWGTFRCCARASSRVSKTELKERLVDCCTTWFATKAAIGNSLNLSWLRNWDGCRHNLNLASEINVFSSLTLVQTPLAWGWERKQRKQKNKIKMPPVVWFILHGKDGIMTHTGMIKMTIILDPNVPLLKTQVLHHELALPTHRLDLHRT